MKLSFFDHIPASNAFFRLSEDYFPAKNGYFFLKKGVLCQKREYQWSLTALKIISFFTVIIPFVLICGKVIHRLTHTYTTQTVEHHDKIPFIENDPIYIVYKETCYQLTIQAQERVVASQESILKKGDQFVADLFVKTGSFARREKFRVVRGYIEAYMESFRLEQCKKIDAAFLSYLDRLSEEQDRFVDRLFEGDRSSSFQFYPFIPPKIPRLLYRNIPYSSRWMPIVLREEFELLKYFIPLERRIVC